MKKVVATRKDIAFYLKMAPLPMHREAYDKAKAIVCEKSISLLEDAYAKKAIPKPKCKTSAVDENIALMNKLGISGVPTLILPNGAIAAGAKDAKSLEALIGKK